MAKVRAVLLTVLSFISLVMLVMTVVKPDWIEEFFGVEPDAGSGSAEALITLAFVALTVISGLSAVRGWRNLALHAQKRSTVDGG
jgi:hypothetical protein